MTAFADNFVVLDQANRLRLAMLQLSKSGYLVRRFSGGERAPSIEIDRPLSGADPIATKRGAKIFFSVEYEQCRVYWVAETHGDQVGRGTA